MLARSLIALLLLTGAAQGACYDVYGCSDRNLIRAEDLANGASCQFLYTMRNQIYRDRFYCFATPRAIELFGNAGCQFDNVNEVPLNHFERANVATIQSVERAMGCSH
jgi:hypothetical protein